jgi:hypothetical protein
MVVFRCVLWVGWQFQTLIPFPEVNRSYSWNKKLEKYHSSDWDRCQKAIGGIYFTRKWRAETLQPGLEFDNFKPRLKSGIFKCISWLNGSFFGCDDPGFLKERVKTYLIAPRSPLNSPIFFSFFASTVYGNYIIHLRRTRFRWKIAWLCKSSPDGLCGRPGVRSQTGHVL